MTRRPLRYRRPSSLDKADGAGQGEPMSFVATLRAATAADHDRVDARFGALRLDDPGEYRCMLTAHARALPAVEAALAQAVRMWSLPVWHPRTPLLMADLAALNVSIPSPLPFALPCGDGAEGAAWGALYVMEGSRLGGQLLARRVGSDLPHAYLDARHEKGAWRALLAALDDRAERASPAWPAGALEGAGMTFALYARALGMDDE